MGRFAAILTGAFDIRPGDGRPVALLLAHSFFFGASLVLLEVPANTLFLQKFPVEYLSYVYILTAVVSTLLGVGYSALESRVSPGALMAGTLLMLTMITGAFYGLLVLGDYDWVVFGLMIWKDVLWILSGMVFWGAAGLLFNVRQAKRFFGLVATGEVVAGIVTGFAVAFLVSLVGTLALVAFGALATFASLYVLSVVTRAFPSQFASPAAAGGGEHEETAPLDWWRRPYILLFFGVSMLSYVAFYLVDYVFYDRVESAYTDESALASFFGMFSAILGAGELVSKGFVSRWLLSRFGLGTGLLALPVIVSLMSGVALLASILAGMGAFLWIIVVTKLLDEVLRNSILSPSFRILYQPLPLELRIRVQAIRESVVEPSAIGISGVLLIVLVSMLSLDAAHLLYVVLAVLVASVPLTVLLRRRYTTELTSALAGKKFQRLALPLHDPSTREAIHRGLSSSNPAEVSYCLKLLEEEDDPRALATALVGLLAHASPEVRRQALERIDRSAADLAVAAVRRCAQTDPSPAVRGAALGALCTLIDQEAFEEVSPHLGSPDEEVRRGAMIGLLRNAGIDGVLIAGAALNRMLGSVNAEDRRLAAEVLGEVGIVSFFHPLLALLADPRIEVRKQALAAAGRIRHPRLLPAVIDCLEVPSLRRAALAAILRFGDRALPELERALDGRERPQGFRKRIARICGRIGGDEVRRALVARIQYSEEPVRMSVLGALSLCRYRATKEEVPTILAAIRSETEDAAWSLAALADVIADDPGSQRLEQALRREFAENRSRVLSLLSYVYDSESIMHAKANLDHESSAKRAEAIEMIDEIVDREVKDLCFPLIDEIPWQERLARLSSASPQARLGRDERLREILGKHETTRPWTRGVTILAATSQPPANGLDECLTAGASDPDPIVREVTAWAVASRRPGGQGEKAMLTIEKAIMLKSAPIFSEIPEEWLVDLVSVLGEKTVRAGETIISKGDIGTSMYLIARGRVRVHDGEREIAELGPGEVFGELAALDPEPRVASVTAIEETFLFRIEQDALYAILTEHVEVARGVIRVLCRRLRSVS